MTEAYTIRVDGTPATWTRDSLHFAKLLAQDLANKTGQQATVTLTETGYVEFVAGVPEAGEAAA